MTRRRSQADEATLLQVLGQSPIFRHGRARVIAAAGAATPQAGQVMPAGTAPSGVTAST